MGDLRLVASIETPCAGLRIGFEDWGMMGMPAWCDAVPVFPTDGIAPHTIQAVRGAA